MTRPVVAGAVLVAAPALQILVERSVDLPVGPARMLTLAVWLFAWVPLAELALARAGAAPATRAVRLALWLLVPALGLAHVLAGARLGDGPFGPVPGGPLGGPVATDARPDWSGARALRYAELEVQPARPRSLETLVLVDRGSLYVAANMPERKRWPREVRDDPRVRVRVGGPVHERHARWVDDPSRNRELLAAMVEKYGFDVSLGGDIWFFALEGRPAGSAGSAGSAR